MPSSLSQRRVPLRLAGVFLVLSAVPVLRTNADTATMPAAKAPKRISRSTRPTALLHQATRDHVNWATASAAHWDLPDTSAWEREDRQRDGNPGIPMRVGVNRPVPVGFLSAHTDGSWTRLPDGGALWSMRLEVPGALGIRVHFSQCWLPAGTELALAPSPDARAEVYEANGANRKGSFWSATLPGDVLYLQYSDPSGRAGEPTIVIDEISHIYRFLDPGVGANDDRRSANTSVLLGCHEDVSCFPVDPVARDAVGRVVFTIPGEGTFVCSGALLNDADPNTSAGYFLTASHCIDSQTAADSVNVYWFYQTDECDGEPPGLMTRPRSEGATLLASSSNTDTALLRLHDDPEDGQGFAAWTTIDPSATVIGIHHPSGSYKRYSEGYVTTEPPLCFSLPRSQYVYNDWYTGVIENGSSGSPLFNDRWEIVGQLYGVCYFVEPRCDNPGEYNNVYGRFGASYSAFAPFLKTITLDDAFEDNDSPATAAEIELGLHRLRLIDFDDYFRVAFDSAGIVTATARFEASEMDLDLELLDADGSVLSGPSRAVDNEVLSQSIEPGVYIVHVEKRHGWGGDYTLDVKAVVSSCSAPSPVAAEPEAVIKNRYLSFLPGDPGRSTALRVRLTSLHRPDPPNGIYLLPGSDFSSVEGEVRWVGPPVDLQDTPTSLTSFRAAALQCEPHFMDWGAGGLVHVFGPGVLPSSVYEIEAVEEGCDLHNAGNYSAPFITATTRWGDVAEPYQAPSPAELTQPNIQDIASVVDKFRGLPDAIAKPRAQLQPSSPNPAAAINVLDIAAVVDAFKGASYRFNGPQACP